MSDRRLTVVEHPLVQHKLSYLRDKDTPTVHFRKLANEITLLLTYEATKDLETEATTVEGWAGPVQVRQIVGKKVAVVPILRAGIGMLQGVLDLIPAARVNVVGLYRNEESIREVLCILQRHILEANDEPCTDEMEMGVPECVETAPSEPCLTLAAPDDCVEITSLKPSTAGEIEGPEL